MSAFDDTMTVGEARRLLRTRVAEGARCPVCTQHTKVYKRKLSARMALGMIAVYRAAKREWAHVPTIAGDGCEFGKIRYWGLVEEADTTRDDGGRAGYWRITEKGERWLRGDIRVPSHALVYDSRLLRLDGKEIGPAESLGSPFDFAELMADEPTLARHEPAALEPAQPMFGEEPTYNPPPAPTEAA